MNKPRPTFRMIAQKAGVSLNAVSLALKNHPRISEPTRRRIQLIAQQMGYVPDPMLSSLAAYRTSSKPAPLQSTIAYINSWPVKNFWRSSRAWLQNYEGAVEEAQRYGYRLEEFWIREPGITTRRCNEILRARNIRGVLIEPRPVARGRFNLDLSRISAVAFGYLASPRMHRVTNNQFEMIMLAFHHVRKHGYRRVGLAMPSEYDDRVNHYWKAAFLTAQSNVQPADRVPLLITKNWNFKSFSEWFVTYKPDVVVSLRKGVIPWIQELNKKIPQDVGYVELNRLDPESNLAGINQNSKSVGFHAIRLLVSMMQRNECGLPATPATIMIDPEWVDGPSLKRKSE